MLVLNDYPDVATPVSTSKIGMLSRLCPCMVLFRSGNCYCSVRGFRMEASYGKYASG